MTMTPRQLIEQIKAKPESIEFDDVMAVINDHYVYTEAGFSNGSGDDLVVNPAGSNSGSCRIFAFGRCHGLSELETLACFGQYYRKDVLGNPGGSDHGNIRTFMRHGWQGIKFTGEALVSR